MTFWRVFVFWISLCLCSVTSTRDPLNKILDHADQQYSQGSFASALHSYETALQLSPNDIYSIQGAALASQSLKLYLQSGQYYEFAGKISQIPDFYLNAGMAYKEGGYYDQSIRVYHLCLHMNSNYRQCHIKLAEIYNLLNEMKLVQHHLISAISLNPTDPMSYQYLGDVYNNLKQFQRAIQAYQQSLHLLILSTSPTTTTATTTTASSSSSSMMLRRKVQLLISLGDVSSNIKQPMAALEFYQEAYDLLQHVIIQSSSHEGQEEDPRRPPPSSLLTLVLNAQIGILFSQLPVALWSNYETHVHQIIQTTQELLLQQNQPSILSPYRSLFLPVSPHFIASLSMSWVKAYSREVSSPFSLPDMRSTSMDSTDHELLPVDQLISSKEERATARHLLRIGYVSRRFEDYPGTQMMLRVFQFHNRSRCELYLYALGPDDSSLYRQLVKLYSDQFRDLSLMSFEQSSSLLQQDGLDILVDYDGIHDFNSLKLLMRLSVTGPWTHPSMANASLTTDAIHPTLVTAGTRTVTRGKRRIHVTWLGFAGTTGMTPADGLTYLMVDKIIAPPDLMVSSTAHVKAFTEKLVYLPGSYQPQDEYQGRADISSPSTSSSPDFPLSLLWLHDRSEQRKNILSSHARHWDERSEKEKDHLLHSFWFICFNRLEKVTPDVFEDWMLILARSSNATLILMAESEEVQQQLQVIFPPLLSLSDFPPLPPSLLPPFPPSLPPSPLPSEKFPFLWFVIFALSLPSTHASLILSPHTLSR
jgi:tetratricopeptide (TPR) repeat protein